MFSYYGKLSAEFYDIDTPIGYSFGDVEYYKERLKGCRGKILEPAVGTGRVLIPLLKEGFNVEGMDISSEMLSLCKTHCSKIGLAPNLYKEDMKSFSLPHEYESIIIPAGSFLFIKNREDSINALKCFYNHLCPGGRLIVDIFIPTNFQTGSVSTKSLLNKSGKLITENDCLTEVDLINQHSISYIRYEKWDNEKLVDTELEHFSMRWYGIEEFRMILENIGFKNISISSDYKFRQYPESNDQVITFEGFRK